MKKGWGGGGGGEGKGEEERENEVFTLNTFILKVFL